MPIHIEELLTEVTVVDGDLPFSDAQINTLAALVATRLAEKERAVRRGGQIPRRSIIPTLETRG